ncbi:hypothetical protein DXX99_10295 [Ammonifex thiophilus]|uniref:Uncharacterized protein n=1 Tax=Ammonifex thiophilus TaxID=444093 RepID=A0A3D8P2W1_9THEO|nr:hypothetical protein DXX99_10295 [Ammonifex thiophilus]
MSLQEALDFLKERGYRVRPCVGNGWYEIASPDPEEGEMLVKEKDLLAAFRAGEPERFWEWLRKARLCREL